MDLYGLGFTSSTIVEEEQGSGLRLWGQSYLQQGWFECLHAGTFMHAARASKRVV